MLDLHDQQLDGILQTIGVLIVKLVLLITNTWQMHVIIVDLPEFRLDFKELGVGYSMKVSGRYK